MTDRSSGCLSYNCLFISDPLRNEPNRREICYSKRNVLQSILCLINPVWLLVLWLEALKWITKPEYPRQFGSQWWLNHPLNLSCHAEQQVIYKQLHWARFLGSGVKSEYRVKCGYKWDLCKVSDAWPVFYLACWITKHICCSALLWFSFLSLSLFPLSLSLSLSTVSFSLSLSVSLSTVSLSLFLQSLSLSLSLFLQSLSSLYIYLFLSLTASWGIRANPAHLPWSFTRQTCAR